MVVTTDQDLIRIFRVGRDKFSSSKLPNGGYF